MYLNLKRRILETYKKYATIESQKDFAITINKNVHRDIVSIMFSIHNGQIDINDFDRSFRQYLLKISESKLIQLLDI